VHTVQALPPDVGMLCDAAGVKRRLVPIAICNNTEHYRWMAIFSRLLKSCFSAACYRWSELTSMQAR